MGAVTATTTTKNNSNMANREREEATIKTTICAKFKHVLPAATRTIKTTTTARATTEAAVTSTNAQ